MNAKPFGLNFQSKFARDCRPPGEGEARVSILNAQGQLCVKKIGRLHKDGTCTVTWLGVACRATKERYGWVYRIPDAPGEGA